MRQPGRGSETRYINDADGPLSTCSASKAEQLSEKVAKLGFSTWFLFDINIGYICV